MAGRTDAPGPGRGAREPGARSRRGRSPGFAPRRPGTASTIAIGDIPDAVFATDLDNRITQWAESATALFGYSAAEAVGRPFGDLLPFKMRDPADEIGFPTTIRGGRTWRGQGTVRLRDGTERWIESVVKPTIIDGAVVGSVSVSRDVTETIEAETAIVGEERFANAIVDVVGALVVVLDPAGRIVRFNAACERASGYLAAEVVDRPIWELLIPAEERAASVASFDAMLAGSFPNAHESSWLRRDGSRRLISWSNTCLRDAAGAISHVIETGLDVTDERRAGAALREIEAVGQLLASHGPSPATLDTVLGQLATGLGYGYLTLLLVEDGWFRIAAHRGYEGLPDRLPVTEGVVGRAYRTNGPIWVADVRGDPDYRPDSLEVRSEIAVPLRGGSEVLGVLGIEAPAAAPLTEHDYRVAQAVAERVGSALLLGRERLALAERARLFVGLAEFARVANAILDQEQLFPALIDALAEIYPGDVMTLTVVDRASGRYLIRAVRGIEPEVLGAEVRPGDGPAGRAIEAQALVGPSLHRRSDYAAALRDRIAQDSLTAVGIPLVRNGAVLGAFTIGRVQPDQPFSPVECEVMAVLGDQAALGIANAQLHDELTELAVHDGLTGLYNRRHFDAALDVILARWHRAGGRGPAAIMFDLDHFGRFNKEHGHQAGDAVLRAFAGLLRERLRSADLVARFGGEEFVAILEGCPLPDAAAVADEIRGALADRLIAGPAGEPLHATVSAGCAVLDPREATKEALLRSADLALFTAKRTGRNQVVAA